MRSGNLSKTECGSSLRNWWASSVLLSLAVVLALPPAAWWSVARWGRSGLWASLVAAGACWAGAMIALAIAALVRDPQKAVAGVLAGTLFRTGVPLATALLVQGLGGQLARAGALELILFFYLLALAVETLLSLRLVKAPRRAQRVF